MNRSVCVLAMLLLACSSQADDQHVESTVRPLFIDAFNRDMPYDQFLREQLAGDLLHANDTGDTYSDGITSTGFLAIARRLTDVFGRVVKDVLG